MNYRNNIIVWLALMFIINYIENEHSPFKSRTLNGIFTLSIGLILILLWIFVFSKLKEKFDNPDSRVDHPCPEGSVKHRNGDCRMKGEGEAP